MGFALLQSPHALEDFLAWLELGDKEQGHINQCPTKTAMEKTREGDAGGGSGSVPPGRAVQEPGTCLSTCTRLYPPRGARRVPAAGSAFAPVHGGW